MTKRLVVMCLGPEAGGGFELREAQRRPPAADEIEAAVEAASVNPVDVRRAEGYGRRLLSFESLGPPILSRSRRGRGRRSR
jgi:reticulon-4-interacting protein 1, mitochondrial